MAHITSLYELAGPLNLIWHIDITLSTLSKSDYIVPVYTLSLQNERLSRIRKSKTIILLVPHAFITILSNGLDLDVEERESSTE